MSGFLHGLIHAAKHERDKGNKERSKGLLLAGLGIIAMPIPFIGLPLLAAGVTKAVRAKEGA